MDTRTGQRGAPHSEDHLRAAAMGFLARTIAWEGRLGDLRAGARVFGMNRDARPVLPARAAEVA